MKNNLNRRDFIRWWIEDITGRTYTRYWEAISYVFSRQQRSDACLEDDLIYSYYKLTKLKKN